VGSGRKWWEGSLALSRWLLETSSQDQPRFSFVGCSVVELGAGCSGLPGIVLARDCGATHVLLTDKLPRLVSSLARNICLCGLNDAECTRDVSSLVDAGSCEISAQCFDWAAGPTSSGPFVVDDASVDVIVGAELIWAGVNPVPLAATMKRLLRPSAKKAFDGECPVESLEKQGGGVAFIIMPKGGRGVESQLLAAAAMEGLSCETVVLPWELGEEDGSASCGDVTFEGKRQSQSQNDDWHLHIFQVPKT
jgi:hypothetical protein